MRRITETQPTARLTSSRTSRERGVRRREPKARRSSGQTLPATPRPPAIFLPLVVARYLGLLGLTYALVAVGVLFGLAAALLTASRPPELTTGGLLRRSAITAAVATPAASSTVSVPQGVTFAVLPSSVSGDLIRIKDGEPLQIIGRAPPSARVELWAELSAGQRSVLAAAAAAADGSFIFEPAAHFYGALRDTPVTIGINAIVGNGSSIASQNQRLGRQ